MGSSAAHVQASVKHAVVSSTMLAEVLAGLQQPRKTLPSKYFYDARGSALFDAICELDAYYPTRTELAIMRTHVGEIVEHIGPRCLLVEYGSGSSLKTRVLLDALPDPAAYIPIDISAEHLSAAADRLREAYPALDVHPVAADYTQAFSLPHIAGDVGRVIVYFPGSTIGNFEPREAVAFLRRMSEVAGKGGAVLIGVDLQKDVETLELAYDDPEGVTAAFNLNLLRRLNRELEADFDLDAFAHRAVYNAELGRIEMHLVSQRDQRVCLAGHMIRFRAGETIHTENSYKYTRDDFALLAHEAGLDVEEVWTDPADLFSVQLLEA